MAEDKKAKGIQLGKDAYTAGPVQVDINTAGGVVTLFVHELGYLAVQEIYAKAHNAGAKGTPLASLVAASVKDKEGNTFTIDEVLNLRKEFAEPLFQAVLDKQGITGEPKN